MKTKLITLSSFICLLSLMVTQVFAAEVVMFSTTRTVLTTINNGATANLPINNAGSTVYSPFGGSKYLIHLHFECSVKANDDTTALNIGIVVDAGEPDQQVITPTTVNGNEWCTSIKPSPGTAAAHHRASVGTSVLVAVSGHEFHEITVQRRISGFNAGEEAVVDELSLAVVAQ